MTRDKASPDIQCREWKGVPENCTNAWKEAFDVPSEGYFVPGYCPVCGAETLRRYYYPGCTQAHEVPGMLLPKPGSSWEWCSAVGHMSTLRHWFPRIGVVPPLTWTTTYSLRSQRCWIKRFQRLTQGYRHRSLNSSAARYAPGRITPSFSS